MSLIQRRSQPLPPRVPFFDRYFSFRNPEIIAAQDRLSPRACVAIALLAFVLVAIARLIVVSLLSSDIPFWDQWDSEGWLLLRPFERGELSLSTLFSAHNEHRILISRLVTLALYAINNHQWDNQVSATFNVFFYAATSALVLRRLLLELPWRAYLPLYALVVLTACLPYASENTTTGFQSAFYFLTALSVLGAWLAAVHPPRFASIVLITSIALLSLFSIASGILSAPCFALAAGVRWRREPSARIPLVILATLMLACSAFGFWLTPSILGHAALKAQNIAEFINATIGTLCWPLPGHWYVVVLWMPFAIGALRVLRQSVTSLDAAAFALGAWAVLQGLALAYGRGHEMATPSMRYTDALVPGVLANMYFTIKLGLLFSMRARETGSIGVDGVQGGVVQDAASPQAGRSLFPLLGRRAYNWKAIQLFRNPRSGAMVVALVFALYSGTLAIPSVDGIRAAQDHASHFDAQGDHIRHYLASGDAGELSGKPFMDIPYPVATTLATYLSDPTIRSMLPASIRPGLPLPHDTGFVANGYYPTTSSNIERVVLGSYSPSNGNLNVARMQSKQFETRFPYVSIDMAGYTEKPGLTLSLLDAESRHVQQVIPLTPPHETWATIVVPIPSQTFSLEAEDSNPEFWFAFSEPVEMGRLSALIAWPLKHIMLLAAAYLALICLFAVYGWFRHAQSKFAYPGNQ